jgi:PAS domain S-box-containing protein
MTKLPVIVADDDPVTLVMVEKLLGSEEFEVQVCKNGREALAALSGLEAAVVLVDLEMPELGGLEVVEEIRAAHSCNSTYTIVLTSHTDPETAARCLEAGADDFLRKPPSHVELRARVRVGQRVVRAWLRNRQVTQELETLIELNPVPTMTIDAESFAITRANQAALKLLGSERNDVVGRSCNQTFCEVHREECRGHQAHAAARQDEKTLRTVDGRHIPVLRSVVPVILDGRRHLLECFTDVGQLKATAETRQAQLQFLETLLDTIPNPIFYKNREGVYQGCNRSFADWIGKTPEHIIGRTVEQLYSPELARRYRETDEQLFAQGGHQVYEFQLDNAQGERRDVLYHKATYSDAQGEIAGLVGVIVDITSRKRAEEALRESANRHRSITEVAQDAIITADSEGHIRFWNPAAQRMFGYEASEVLGRNMIGLIVPEEFRNAKRHGLEVFARSGEGAAIGQSLKLRGLHKNGGEFPIEISLNAYRDQTGYVGVALVRDITQTEEAERQLRESNEMMLEALQNEKRASAKLEETMEELAAAQQRLMDTSRQAGMAEVATCVLHNVGNVLNSVNVSVTVATEKTAGLRTEGLAKGAQLLQEMAASGDAPPQTKSQEERLGTYLAHLAEHWAAERNALLQELAELRQHVDHVQTIVARQQDHASQGEVTEEFSLAKAIDDAVVMMKRSLDKDQIEVELRHTCRPTIAGDRHKLAQMLVNLIANARDALAASPLEGRRLLIALTREEDGTVTVRVEDTGVGISEEALPRLFDYGFTTKQNGHGFGLHHSALTAQSMGGSLEAYSDGPGRGATFTLRLPVAQEEVVA